MSSLDWLWGRRCCSRSRGPSRWRGRWRSPGYRASPSSGPCRATPWAARSVWSSEWATDHYHYTQHPPVHPVTSRVDTGGVGPGASQVHAEQAEGEAEPLQNAWWSQIKVVLYFLLCEDWLHVLAGAMRCVLHHRVFWDIHFKWSSQEKTILYFTCVLVSLCQEPPDLAPHIGPELVAWRSLCHRGGHRQSCETISKVSLLTLHNPLITLCICAYMKDKKQTFLNRRH